MLSIGTTVLIVVAGVGLIPLWYDDPEADAARLEPLLALRPGATAAEVGAGRGRLAVALAARLGPEGRVYATEIEAGRRDDIRAAAERAGTRNLTVLEAGTERTNLPPDCCDAVYLRRVYHHFTAPAALAASLFEAVRPGGRLAVIDFAPGLWTFFLFRPAGVPEDRGGHGVPPAIVARELQQAGFVLERRIDDWNWHEFCLVFRKQPSEARP